MSKEDEIKIGAQEHEKIVAQYGLFEDEKLQAYVDRIGRKITQDTERPDVEYKFFILDSPIVNAFALPGGYVYVSRGLITLANNEAELASVMAHEVGHITARHSAERYSQNVVSSVGRTLLSVVVDSSIASHVLGLGSDLYLSSYSRGQEDEADTLGLRYATRGGYNAGAMSSFLASLHASSELENEVNKKKASHSYFSTHPPTQNRVEKTKEEAVAYPPGGAFNRDQYLNVIDGMIYGDGSNHGFVQEQTFIHPDIGFKFTAPDKYKIQNQPSQVVAIAPDQKSVVIFDMHRTSATHNLSTYLQHIWMKNKELESITSLSIGGMPALMGAYDGTLNGDAARIHVIAIQWDNNRYARFQIAMPRGVDSDLTETLQASAQSFRRLTVAESRAYKPEHIKVIKAGPNDTIKSLSVRQSFYDHHEKRFRVLNGMLDDKPVQVGERYKLVIRP